MSNTLLTSFEAALKPLIEISNQNKTMTRKHFCDFVQPLMPMLASIQTQSVARLEACSQYVKSHREVPISKTHPVVQQLARDARPYQRIRRKVPLYAFKSDPLLTSFLDRLYYYLSALRVDIPHHRYGELRSPRTGRTRYFLGMAGLGRKIAFLCKLPERQQDPYRLLQAAIWNSVNGLQQHYASILESYATMKQTFQNDA